jgi:hypothetical protein
MSTLQADASKEDFYMKRIVINCIYIITLIVMSATLIGCNAFKRSTDSPSWEMVTLLKHSASVSEMKRIATTMAVYAASPDFRAIESLYSQAIAAYSDAMAYMDEYAFLVRDNSKHTQNDKDERLAIFNEIMRLMDVYRYDVLENLRSLAMAGNFDAAFEIIISTADLAAEIRYITDILIEMEYMAVLQG